MRVATVANINGLTAAVDRTGSEILTDQMFYCSAQVVTSGTATGTLKLQASNDIVNPTQPYGTPTHWFDITNASVTVASAGTVGIMKTELCYQFIRAVWTKDNGGTGTITVNIQLMGN